MAHFSDTATKMRSTPREWLRLGSQITELANTWSGRGDLVAYVGNDGGQGMAPAIFVPSTAEVEINTEIAFTKGVKPGMVGNMTDRSVQFENAKASGAVWHEAQHAQFTTWSLADAHEALKDEPGAHRALMNLEESRIEALGLRAQPQNRPFIRACALEIVIGDQKETAALSISPTRQMGHLIALTKARIDAGVLKPKDIKRVSAQIDAVLDEKLQGKLRALWREFQGISRPQISNNLYRMYDIAREWDKLIEDEAQKNGEPSAEDIAKALAEAMAGEGDGAGSDIEDALNADAEDAGVDAQNDADTQQRIEKQAKDAKDAQKRASERENHKAASQRVFNKGTGYDSSPTRSRLVKERPPTSEEVVAANTVAREMEKAKYRDRDRVVARSTVPPGRLRTRTMIQSAAMTDRGIHNVPEAWRRVHHRQTDEPTLTVGMMVDISGSMGSVMQPMATAAWVMSEAGRRIDAHMACVYYGNSVFPTLAPGQHLEKVRIYGANDGTEKFNDAFQAIDGALELLNGRGARLLVVVSDGHYVSEERVAALKWLQRCRADGVGVLWIGLNGSYGGDAAAEYCKKSGAVYIQTNGSVTDVSMKIGQAAAEALTRAGSAR